MDLIYLRVCCGFGMLDILTVPGDLVKMLHPTDGRERVGCFVMTASGVAAQVAEIRWVRVRRVHARTIEES
jgi:hypothetical protein